MIDVRYSSYEFEIFLANSSFFTSRYSRNMKIASGNLPLDLYTLKLEADMVIIFVEVVKFLQQGFSDFLTLV